MARMFLDGLSHLKKVRAESEDIILCVVRSLHENFEPGD